MPTKKKPKAKKPAKRRPEPGSRSPQKVADMMARPGGASMAELVAAFAMEAHPMRSKIHSVRHELGYSVVHERRDGDAGPRYYATPPKG